MGESGSGKSTMLNVLSGRAGYGKISGNLTLNDQPYEPYQLKHAIGFVQQEYILFDELTVFENFVMAAQLRGTRGETKEHRERRAYGLLGLLGLTDVRDFVLDKRIGNGRLSGGQLRRVSIGVELAADASLLFLDEPTSALDAVNTRLVVGLLRCLASAGMIVVASIHQPRISAYEMFDRLLLLRKGQLVYGGGAAGAASFYFASLGYQMSERANPADFYIEVCFGMVDSQAKPPVGLGELAERWRSVYFALEEKANAEEAEQHGRGTATLDEFILFWTAHPSLKLLDVNSAHVTYARCRDGGGDGGGGGDGDAGQKGGDPTWEALLAATRRMPMPPSNQPSFSTQFKVCLLRCALKRLRLRDRFYLQMGIMIVLSVVAGMATGSALVSDTAMLSATVALFSTYVATLSIETVAQGMADELFEHEAAGGVRQLAEILARMLVDACAWALLPVVFVLPFASLTNFGSAGFDMLGITYFLMWSMQPIGYFITILNRKNATVAVSSASLILTIFLSTQLGPNLAEAPFILAFSPARWAVPALSMSYLTTRPFSTARAALEMAMLRTAVMPADFDLASPPSSREDILDQMRVVVRHSKNSALKSQLTFCAAQQHNESGVDLPVGVIILDEYDSLAAVGWYGEALFALFVMGVFLRIAVAAAFVKRTREWEEIPVLGVVAKRLSALSKR